MSRSQAAIVGVASGLVAPAITLAFLWSGLGFTIVMGKVNLTYLLWPSSRILLIGWQATTRGILTTVFAVLINCFLYAIAASLLPALILKVAHAIPAHQQQK
jgi:hypothetical protein